MKILALELSSARGSIAWLDGFARPVCAEFANDRKHSGVFFEQLKMFTNEHGKPDRIAVGLGPGSYAGTRIAIAAALGLQTATGAGLIGIASARAIPSSAREYAAVGDARRHSFYFALVVDRRCVEGPLLYDEQQLHERLASLNVPVFSTEPLHQFQSASPAFPSALLLAEIATTEQPTATPLEPIYLREPHITEPKSVTATAKR